MIEFRVGDPLDDDAEAFVNDVNCVGVADVGLAAQFREAFPANFEAYRQACEAGEVRPGNLLVHRTGALRPRWILNFPTQRHWSATSQLSDIADGLDALVATILRLAIRSVAIPPLGVDTGGLDWDDVRPLIEERLEPLTEVTVRVYEPRTIQSGMSAPSRQR